MENRIILIDKPSGISSFGVVAKVRAKLRDKLGHKVKVGHTGTLDPFATGLLILLSGQMTKKSSDFLKLDKIYEATLKLGYVSTTGDPEGEITLYKNNTTAPEDTLSRSIFGDGPNTERLSPVTTAVGAEQTESLLFVSRRRPADDLRSTGARERSEKDVSLALNKFTGKITQKVPQYSAVKINGKRAYKLARKGKYFETPTREITIYNIELLDYNYPELTIKVHCSSGTYIRTLAEDIGKALQTGAYLTALRRTRIHNFSVEDAKTIDEI